MKPFISSDAYILLVKEAIDQSLVPGPYRTLRNELHKTISNKTGLLANKAFHRCVKAILLTHGIDAYPATGYWYYRGVRLKDWNEV